MSKILYRLHNIPDDELADILELLEDNGVDYYQTHAGRWLLGIAALWVRSQEDYEVARQLIEDYLERRYNTLAEERERLRDVSFIEGMYERLRQDPKGFIVNVMAIAIVLMLSFSLTVLPFLTGA